MRRSTITTALVALAVAALVAPALAQAPAPAIPRLKTPLTVKVGFAAGSMSVAGVYVAIARGYFREAGITNEFVALNSFNQLIGPIATGELDIGSAGPSAALFNALERGVNLRLVADQNTVFPGHASIAMMVRKDLVDGGQVKTVADLKGRTFALAARRATMELDLIKALRQAGLTISDIKLVVMPFPQINAALAGKSIDAGWQLEPLVAAAVSQNIAVRFKGLDEITPNRQNGIFVYSEKFAANQEAARAWMVAYVRGLRDYNDAVLKGRDREFVIQTLMKFTTVKERAPYDHIVLPGLHPDGDLNVESIREAYSEFKAAGDIKGEVNLDAVIDRSFVRHAVEILGPYRR
jgi:NitT/TauT family transport system substrate-binding protein